MFVFRRVREKYPDLARADVAVRPWAVAKVAHLYHLPQHRLELRQSLPS